MHPPSTLGHFLASPPSSLVNLIAGELTFLRRTFPRLIVNQGREAQEKKESGVNWTRILVTILFGQLLLARQLILAVDEPILEPGPSNARRFAISAQPSLALKHKNDWALGLSPITPAIVRSVLNRLNLVNSPSHRRYRTNNQSIRLMF